MKTDWMEGEMEEILKGMLYDERLCATAVYVLSDHIGRIKIPDVGSTFLIMYVCHSLQNHSLPGKDPLHVLCAGSFLSLDTL